MKVAITVTAVCEFPDDIEFEDVMDDEDTLGQHLVVNGRKLRPIIDFLEYKGIVDDSPTWDDFEDKDLEDIIGDSIETEDYTILPIDGAAEE